MSEFVVEFDGIGVKKEDVVFVPYLFENGEWKDCGLYGNTITSAVLQGIGRKYGSEKFAMIAGIILNIKE